MLVFLAASPILLFIITLSIFKIPALKGGPVSFIYASLCAFFIWKFPLKLWVLATLEGILFALLFIGIIIFAAIILSDLLERTGSSEIIKTFILSITHSKAAAAVIIAWGLEIFLEAIAGFGSGLVLPTTILIALGLSPFRAALCALLANSMPTAYGGVGTGMTLTAAAAGISVNELYTAFNSILFLPSLIIPFLIARCAVSSWKEVWKISPVPLGAFIGQRIGYLIPSGVSVNSILGAIFCLIGTIIAAQLFVPQKSSEHKLASSVILKAFAPFLIAVSLILFTSPLNIVLSPIFRTFDMTIFVYPDAPPLRFNWLTAPGLPLLIAALFGSFIQGANTQMILDSFKHVGKRIGGTLIVLISILTLSRVMTYSGMISTISQALSQNLNNLYLPLAPILGAFGSFTTGSITSAAILLASLNSEIAQNIGVKAAWVVALYSSGATAFNMVTPYALGIISAVLGTRKYEHRLMAKIFPIALAYLSIIIIISLLIKG